MIFGIASLVTVEIRSWFLRVLEVDVPVLKILGGATIAEIVEYAVKKLPAGLAPGVSEQNQPAATSNPAAASAAGSLRESSTSSSTSPPSVSATSGSGEATESSSMGSSRAPSSSSSPNYTFTLQSQTIEKTVPMSFGQSRFWFMSQFVTDPTVFNVTCSILITEEAKIQNRSMAVRTLGSRHEALRTCFFNADKHQSMQGILAESPLCLETLNISSQQDV